jgi:pSer/pThr/pTyr-binding forkhead associated (FHA) protein
VVDDLGSTNGTLVNDVAADERALEDGDRITIGSTVLEFRTG